MTGVDVDPYHVPIDEVREEFAEMFRWFNEEGYHADIDALEAEFGVDPTGLKTYLREHGWAGKASLDTMPGWAKAMG